MATTKGFARIRSAARTRCNALLRGEEQEKGVPSRHRSLVATYLASFRPCNQPGASLRGDLGCKGFPDVIPSTVGIGSRYSFPSRSPFLVFLNTLSNAEGGDFADQ